MSFRPATSLLHLTVRRAAGPRHPSVQRRTFPSSVSSTAPRSGTSSAGSKSNGSSRSSSSSSHARTEPPKQNKHKQWYRELVPAALPALAVGLSVYMALHLLRLTLSSERELLALQRHISTLEAELQALQDARAKSMSSQLREMFSHAAGGRGVVDALTDPAPAAGREDGGAPAQEGAQGAEKQRGKSWWSWGRS